MLHISKTCISNILQLVHMTAGTVKSRDVVWKDVLYSDTKVFIRGGGIMYPDLWQGSMSKLFLCRLVYKKQKIWKWTDFR